MKHTTSTPESSPTIREGLRPGDLSYIMAAHQRWYWPTFGYSEAFEYIVAKALAESYEMTAGSRSRWWLVDGPDGEPVGSLVLLDRGEMAQLRFFYLEPAARGRGLGQQLLQHFVDHLRANGFSGAYLWTTASQIAACALYAAYGFRITDRQETSTFGVVQEELRYELRLT